MKPLRHTDEDIAVQLLIGNRPCYQCLGTGVYIYTLLSFAPDLCQTCNKGFIPVTTQPRPWFDRAKDYIAKGWDYYL